MPNQAALVAHRMPMKRMRISSTGLADQGLHWRTLADEKPGYHRMDPELGKPGTGINRSVFGARALAASEPDTPSTQQLAQYERKKEKERKGKESEVAIFRLIFLMSTPTK